MMQDICSYPETFRTKVTAASGGECSEPVQLESHIVLG